ncbi:acyl-CoA dehydrogenase [Nocardia pseudovaccinii]|uniref:acyl-CoA dehydrogenase n=1 Tax=Nocardia pseudovaccinii TaxID=189540 RepID=UPI003D94B3B2
MRMLDEAMAVCDGHLPGLLDELRHISLHDIEQPGNPGLELFRKYGGPGLVIPTTYGGLGVSPVDAVRVVRAIGAQAPSLAVATAMHHFSVATIFTLADSLKSSGLEWALLEGIADQKLLVSSGFAEGNPGQGILTPTMTATRADSGIIVNGSKRPCSMSASMDLLSASVSITDDTGRTENALLLVPKAAPGVSVHPFWHSSVLTGAESDEVRLTDVFVDQNLVVPAETGAQGELDELQTVGFIWFEMLITSCYLGMASALVRRVFDLRAQGRVSTERLTDISVRLETAALLLDDIARMLSAKETDNSALLRTMIARYGAQDAILDAAAKSIEALGGMSFISAPDVAYLAAACHCVSFHPPTRTTGHDALAAGLTGDVLRIA